MKKPNPENLETQILSLYLSFITNLQSGLKPVASLFAFTPSLVDGFEDSFQFWHDILWTVLFF